ncbi:MAG: hypothetical protein FD153_412, partial [Rhodospirillaceae bacterium]
MKRFALVSVLAIAAAIGIASTSTAEAWWGGGPWNNNGWGDTGGDFSMNFSGRGTGTGSGYNGYNGPGYYGGGYPGYGGYGGGYPGYGGYGGGYPGYGGYGGGYPGY